MHRPGWGVSGCWIHSGHLWYGWYVHLLSALALRFRPRAWLRTGHRRCYQTLSRHFRPILGVVIWWEWLPLIEGWGHAIRLTNRICRDNGAEDATVLRDLWGWMESLLRQLNLHLRCSTCMGLLRGYLFEWWNVTPHLREALFAVREDPARGISASLANSLFLA